MLDTSEKCESMLRKIRRHDKMWCGDARREDQCSRLIGKVKERLFRIRSRSPQVRGPFSGLTRGELRASGTCEADWF